MKKSKKELPEPEEKPQEHIDQENKLSEFLDQIREGYILNDLSQFIEKFVEEYYKNPRETNDYLLTWYLINNFFGELNTNNSERRRLIINLENKFSEFMREEFDICIPDIRKDITSGILFRFKPE